MARLPEPYRLEHSPVQASCTGLSSGFASLRRVWQ